MRIKRALVFSLGLSGALGLFGTLRAQDEGGLVPPAPAPEKPGADLFAGRAAGRPDVVQKLKGVLPSQAARLYCAMSQGGDHDTDEKGVEMRVAWRPISKTGIAPTLSSSWSIYGSLSGSYKIKRSEGGGLFKWIAHLFSSEPSNETVSYSFDRNVLIEYVGQRKLLAVTMTEANEVLGTYNVVVVGDKSSSFQLQPTVSLASKSFGFSAGTKDDKYEVAVTGLPYILAPQLILDSEGEQNLLRLRMGFLWESRGQILAEHVDGVESKNSFDVSLSYGGDEIKAEVGHSSDKSDFTGSLSVRGNGDGLLARIVYDEAAPGWTAELKTDQSWDLHIAGAAIMNVGDVHFDSKQQRSSSPPAPLDPSMRPPYPLLSLNGDDRARAAFERNERLKEFYGPSKVPTPSSTPGLLKKLSQD